MPAPDHVHNWYPVLPYLGYSVSIDEWYCLVQGCGARCPDIGGQPDPECG